MQSAQECLAADTGDSGARLEALLREIDANFTADQLPAELAPLREQLRARLRVAETLRASQAVDGAAPAQG